MSRILLGLCLVFAACGAAADERAWSCRLERVVDGDTIHARCRGESVKVRLLRIDTPERDEAGYQAAATALRRILGADPIELEFEKPGLPVADDYGRLLAYVRVRGENANVEMVRLGWSRFWTKYGEGRLAADFRRAEREAREAQRGLWAEGAPPAASAAPPTPALRSHAAACRARSECCRICARGRACGDSCIAAASVCHPGQGCACDRAEVCASPPR